MADGGGKNDAHMTIRNETGPVAAVDAGNTHIRVVVRENGAIGKTFEFPTGRDYSAEELESRFRASPDIDGRKLRGAVYSSVVKELDAAFDVALARLTGGRPVRVSSAIRTGFDIRYEPASSLGADRIANAAEALGAYPGENIIVVDAGTAVTFCVLLAEKVFDGGLIVPGTGLAAEALSTTSRLPLVSVDGNEPLVGKNTHDGIAGGILHGWAAMIDGLASRIEEHYGRRFLLLLTGGCAPMLSPQVKRKHLLDTELTFKGLFRLYDLNA